MQWTSLLSRIVRDEDFLKRIEDRIELKLSDLVGNHHTQLIVIEHAVLVGLAVHAVGDGELGLERLLDRRQFAATRLPKLFTDTFGPRIAK